MDDKTGLILFANLQTIAGSRPFPNDDESSYRCRSRIWARIYPSKIPKCILSCAMDGSSSATSWTPPRRLLHVPKNREYASHGKKLPCARGAVRKECCPPETFENWFNQQIRVDVTYSVIIRLAAGPQTDMLKHLDMLVEVSCLWYHVWTFIYASRAHVVTIW